MGTKQELTELVRMVAATGLRPEIDRVMPFEEAADAIEAMEHGELLGKAVFVP